MITCYFEDGNKALLRHVVIDVLVFNDKNEILMVKRTAKLTDGGKWGIIGGYAERDETVAEAAAREIQEETGWTIKDLTMMTIIDDPDRPSEDRQNISFVYFCKVVEKVGEPDWESDEVRWYSLDELPPREQIAFDHADDIELYKRCIKENLTLPIL
jgi:ADP-ribose pyrophosphatase YjhB (NUDIX family)